MMVQITFDDPLEVSNLPVRKNYSYYIQDYDWINVRLLQENMIISEDLLNAIDPENILKGELPPQLPDSCKIYQFYSILFLVMTRALDLGSQSLSFTMVGVISSNLILSIIAGVSMKKLWAIPENPKLQIKFQGFNMKFKSSIVKRCQF